MKCLSEVEELRAQVAYYERILKAPANMAVRQLSDDYKKACMAYAEQAFLIVALREEIKKLKERIAKAAV